MACCLAVLAGAQATHRWRRTHWKLVLESGIIAAMLTFSQSQFDQMLAHVLSDPTREMCGLLAGRGDRVQQVLLVPNALNSPWAYRMDGPEFAEAMMACDFEPLGIFHSHVAGPPTPSPTDVAEANYPDSVYVIISFHQSPASVRAFRIVEGQVSEEAVAIVGED